MKKKCTPQNNAITIKTPVCCPEPIVPIVDGCVDPFTYTWNMAVNQAILDDTMSVAEHFDILLDLGQVLSDASNVCCPSCDITPVYTLSSVETFLKVAEALGWFGKPDLLCCVNVAASVETNIKYNSVWKSSQPLCCNNDFESCLNQFSNIALLTRILEKGVVETNGYNNTLLCTIYNLLINTPEDLFQGATLAEVFDRIIDKGFVSYCCGCNVFIGSAETFLKWFEATGGCQSKPGPEPPPFKTVSVYSQVLQKGATYNSIEYKCNGLPVAYCYGTNKTTIDDLVSMFNSNPPVQVNSCFLNYGTYYNNGDGTIRCEMPASVYLSLCAGGAVTLNVIYD